MFRDGSFLQIGWPSITVFSSSDYKRVALTDYDRFPEDIDGEGDGFSLASKRTTTFMSAGDDTGREFAWSGNHRCEMAAFFAARGPTHDRHSFSL